MALAAVPGCQKILWHTLSDPANSPLIDRGLCRKTECIVQARGNSQAVPDGKRSDAAPHETGSYIQYCAQGMGKKCAPDTSVATGKCELVYDDI